MNEETFYEYIKELIDHWNLKVTLSQEELKSLFTNISERAITWEFYTSLITVIVWLLIFVVFTRYILKLNKERSFKESFKILTESVDTNVVKKDMLRVILFCMYVVVLVMVIIPLIVTNFIDLFECYYFPEKVVIDFFGQYMK